MFRCPHPAIWIPVDVGQKTSSSRQWNRRDSKCVNWCSRLSSALHGMRIFGSMLLLFTDSSLLLRSLCSRSSKANAMGTETGRSIAPDAAMLRICIPQSHEERISPSPVFPKRRIFTDTLALPCIPLSMASSSSSICLASSSKSVCVCVCVHATVISA